MDFSIVANLEFNYKCLLNTTQHSRHQKCERLRRIATNKFFNIYIKKCDLTNLFDQFHSTGLFSTSFCLYRACFTHLISSNLSCNPAMFMVLLLRHFDKKNNANVYLHGLWEYYLTPHMTLYIETCIRQTPCIKRAQQHSPRVST